MSDYKLVPVEPTTAMREVWKRMRGYCWYDKYKAMLAAAPAVQEEPVAMSKDKMRDEFDSWIEQQGMITMKDGETYYHHVTHAAWQAWKASRAALAAYRHHLQEGD